MAQKLFVIMGNDYPDGVCSTEEKANEIIAQKRTAPNAGRIRWRFYEYWLDGIEPDPKQDASGLKAMFDAVDPKGDIDAIDPRDTLIKQLAEALQAAGDHLGFCGYGDAYERECAEQQGLEANIEKALEAYEKAGG